MFKGKRMENELGMKDEECRPSSAGRRERVAVFINLSFYANRY